VDTVGPDTIRPIDLPQANRLLRTLGAVHKIEERLRSSSIRKIHPESALVRDQAAGNAASGFNCAASALAAAVDHLRTWYYRLGGDLERFSMPIMSHYTLARAVYESSLQALWLLDPAVDSRTRIGRGYAVELQSLVDLRKFQAAANMPSNQANAEMLIERLLAGAEREGFLRTAVSGNKSLTISPPTMVELFNAYDAPDIPGRRPEWRYRILSGMAHGRRWAIASNAEVETATDDGHFLIPNWEYLQVFADFTTQAASRAVNAFVEYRCEPTSATNPSQ